MLVFLVASSLALSAYATQLQLPMPTGDERVKIGQWGGWGSSNDDAEERAQEADNRAKQAEDDSRRAEWEAQQAEKRAEEDEQKAQEAEDRNQQNSGW